MPDYVVPLTGRKSAAHILCCKNTDRANMFLEDSVIIKLGADSVTQSATDPVFNGVRDSIGLSLQIQEKAQQFTEETRLLGDLPELDSMAVLTVITGLEEHFGIVIDDDEISAETFESVGNLVALVRDKLG